MTCRYDRTAEDYLTDDGRPCRHDDYGDPTHHCTARRTCAQHVGPRELTCARCVGRTRTDLRWIRDLAALMPSEALAAGVNSEAANLAGPGVDAGAWTERRVAMRSHLATWHSAGRITEDQYLHARATMEDDDDLDPYRLLTRWEFMLREDYDQLRPGASSTEGAADYLDRTLQRLAQDDEQDFPLFRREVRRCRTFLESVIHNSQAKERGAPCPDCGEKDLYVRLVREYGHWCTDEDCERLHYLDDSGDRWVCPADKEHVWSHSAYSNYIEARRAG